MFLDIVVVMVSKMYTHEAYYTRNERMQRAIRGIVDHIVDRPPDKAELSGRGDPVSCLRPETEDEMAKSGMSLRHGTIEMKKLGVHRRDAVDKKKLKCSGVRMFQAPSEDFWLVMYSAT